MKRFGTGLGLVIGTLWAFAGCAEKSPLEQLVENRSRYSAEVNGFYVDATPVVVETATASEGEAEAEMEATPAEDEEMASAEAAPVPVIQNAHLDILLRHDSMQKLPGVTLDIVQVDANLKEKGRWRVWVDTSKVERANPTQYSHVLDGIDYVEGDGFSVEVRHPIPEAERGDYKEFESVGS